MDILFDSNIAQIFIILFIALFSISSFFWPRFTGLILPIILPFYLIKIKLELPLIVLPINLLELLIIIFMIINWRLAWKGISDIFPRLNKPFFASITLMLLASLVSVAFAINQKAALGAAKSWFWIPILLFFTFLPLFRSFRYRGYFLSSLTLSGIVISVMSLPFIFSNLYAYDGRLAGIFLSPNHLAMALVPGILALIILILNYESRIMNHGDTVPTFLSSSGLPARRSESKGGTRACLPALRRRLRQGEPARQGSRKILYLLLLALELLLLYLTYSYGTWISIIVASLLTVILNFFCHPERAQRAEGSLSIKRLLLIIIFGALALSQYNNPKLQHIVNSDYYSSLHSRIMIWQSALLVSRDHWLTGVGAGNFQQAYLDYQSRFPEPYIEWAVPQPHNIFLAFLTQLGIIGLISFILIVLLTLFIVIPAKAGIQKSNFKLRITDPLTLWATAYLVYLIVHGLVDTPYFKNDLAILFWLALAIIWSLNTTRTIDCGSQQK